MSIKRYEWVDCDEHACHCDVVESAEGDMVDYADYAALEQRLIESERYGRQTDITIDNLEMKVAQMAAELASVKQQEPKAWFIRITDEVTVDAREGEKWRGVPLVRIDVETPNHDDFLAEVRAQGVEMFGQYHNFSEKLFIQKEAQKFAENLRKGVQS